ncbi:uncharacterized protein LOC123270308 [Cotesia glomerata]|uniref:C2H2-type domain-containing protein n=1 Tax=Cotesia glomerata TaxID=32391 RepID=A0AAV7I1K1_COTGL|nr:uncharacterized protein LOC123270308 [Cotesia glomerata]XP_044592243.1 uncharacterized protein LOC123270308 [Cotesia glomerata]KAH0552052.1 hypothetical protein KQX54_004684 [Cotesia glomerata]
MTEFARTVPRIKKSKSTFKWGQQYYTALQDAVFPIKHNLYSTPEIPSKLADNIDVKKGKYSCNQCGDSFHFQSSLDDHLARYSWILGYWCRYCTKLECTHQKAPRSNPSSSISCPECKVELKKRCAYFKARGLKGGERVGKILIFYNQCQFFGHLKYHGITAVDMCDMMLMPIPMTIQSDEYAQLDSVSRTLFECMFIKNIHIMDWLRLENINFKWWTVTGSDDNPVGKLIRQHEFDIVRANRLIKSVKDHELAAINNVQDPEEDNDSNTDNSSIKNEEKSPVKEISENHCDLNEIEFVDCASLDDSLITEAPPTAAPPVIVKTEPPSSSESTTGELLKIINKPSAKLANLADINHISLNRNTVTHLINRNLKISSSNTLQTTTLSNITGAGKKNQIIIINKNKDSDKSSEVKANVQILSNSGQDAVKLFKQAGGGRVFFQPGMKPVILKQVPKPLNASKLDGEKKYTVPKFSVVKNKLKILSGNSVPVTLVTSAQMLKSVSTLTTASSTLSTPTAPKQTVLQIRDGSGLKTISVAPEKCTKLIPMEALHKPKEVLQKEMELLQKKNLNISGQIRQKSLISYTPQTVQLSSIPKGTKIVQTIQAGPKLVPVTQSSVKFPRPVQTYQKLQTVVKIGQNSGQKSVAKIGKTLLKPIESLLKPEAQTKELKDTFVKKVEEDPLSGEAFPQQVQKVDRGQSVLKLCAPDKKQNTVRAYREAMILSFQQSRKRVQPLIDNIIETNEIYEKTNVDVHSVKTVNEMALSKFKIYLDNNRNVKMTDDDKINEELHHHSDNWEAKADSFNKYCERCHLKLKPQNYIIGISDPSEQEDNYCQCYNHVCHLCNARQGTLARYNVHMCFHMKEFPYTCPECFKKFPSIQHLEIHIWQQCYHIKTHQSWTCNVCEIEGFLTKEHLARHYFKIHSKSVSFCNLCRKKFDSFSEFRAHNSEIHGIINTQFSNASRLIKCDFGDCLTKPEAFSEHVAAHVTVDKVTHYICPFCNFSMGEISINGHLIQRHVFKAHPERLKEVITNETLSVFIKMNLVNPQAIDRPPSPSIKIVNAFPISSKAFNQQATNSVEILHRRSESMPIKIIDVRTEKADEPVNHKLEEEITELPGSSLKIIDVTSMSKGEYSDDNNEDDDKNKMIKNSIEKLSKLGVSLSAIKKNDKPKKAEEVGTHDEISIINNFSKRKSSPPPLVLINNVNLLELDKEDDKKDVVQIECIKDNKVMIRNDLFNLEGVSIQRKSFGRKKQRLAMNGPLFKKEMVHYNCHLCGELINTNWYVINDHFRECHSAGYRIVSMTPCLRRLTNFEIMKYTGIKRGNSDLMLTPKKRRRGNYGPLFSNGRKLVDKFGGNNLGFCVTQESLQDVEGNFKCKKCNCLFKDVNVLREHLASNHRIRGHYLVCLECGDNFIVASTLQMHLKAFHGINDPISYLQKNTAYAPDAVDEIEEQDKITESNQCYVCFAVFENKLAVDMHLRVHGMAFLNRKRIEARKALKCPPKFKAASPTPKPEEIKIDDCEDDNANVMSMSEMV